ncbi:MAG: metal-dependent hydrolase [Acidimicrobiales bacterium]
MTVATPRAGESHRIRTRNPNLSFDDDHPLQWHDSIPEFACACNAVSLLMPHVEPFVVRSVERVADRLPHDVRPAALAYARQERQHHTQHRKFNDRVFAQHPGLMWIDRLMARTFRVLDRRSDEFGVAFAAGAETIAYAGARWTDPRIASLFDDAEPTARRLFLWHLAEEVEHKGAAHDVWESFSGSRAKYVAGTITSVLVLAFFAFIGTLGLLWVERRVFSPRAHWNLLVWSITYVFEFLPLAVISALPGHHPNDLTDPVYLSTWLRIEVDNRYET